MFSKTMVNDQYQIFPVKLPLGKRYRTSLIMSHHWFRYWYIQGQETSHCWHDEVIKWKRFSVLLALCAGNSSVTGEFPTQRPVTWSFDVFFDLRLNKRLIKQSWGWWFETPTCSLWRHCDDHDPWCSAPNRQQAITWIKAGQVLACISRVKELIKIKNIIQLFLNSALIHLMINVSNFLGKLDVWSW